MAPLSEEEENYVRLALLLKGVASRAVRFYFDRIFPPTNLPSTLTANTTSLSDLKIRRIINQAQWNILFPRNGVPDSKTFDVTLMICLIRNLTSTIHPTCPINGFDSPPLPWETTPESDLARMKCYRNKLAHPDCNTIDNAYFNTAWRDISDVVCRLGGTTLYQECQELKVKILDQSNQEIILEIKQSQEEMKDLRLTIANLETKLSKVTAIVKNPMSLNIKDQIKKQIEDWQKRDKMFVSTRASDYVLQCLHDNRCLTLTGPPGVGKSFISRHAALVLQKEGYLIIPVYSPTDIRDYYQPGMQTVFIVDDICGNFTANQQQIDNWKQLLPVIDIIIADKCCKIIVSCRLQVYKDEKFNILEPFKSCECNLVSVKLCLTYTEQRNIAKTYIGTNSQNIEVVTLNSDLFPFLWSVYHKERKVSLNELFENPYDVFKIELDKLGMHGDEGNYQLCSLALCVLFNNQLEEKWFQGKVTDAQRHIIEDTCDACDINRSTSKAKLKKTLDTLEGTFICKENGIYRTLHNRLFDFLAHYFGKKMIGCLIDHGDSQLVNKRFIWQKSPNDKTSIIDFSIEIPEDYLESYLERLVNDWLTGIGNKISVYSNKNMHVSSFRNKFLEKLTRIDKSIVVNTKTGFGSGNTSLMCTYYHGYDGIGHWTLRINEKISPCSEDGVTGLYMAHQKGDTDKVTLLFQYDFNDDVCNNNVNSPLYYMRGDKRIDIVKLFVVSDKY